ncbi:hypothetical protein [Actinomadura sp. WMMA1423]|uniref:hypothetical protein n=1 Tax=Actinomadura sp. WMMA1423 TaxID=2591108 RepID=UPI00197A8E88|nr:hypothetical protein [Actinomadura sp. WMMA1423]
MEKLNALRLGQRLAVEVPAGGPGRRAFVTIHPVTTPADDLARREGWKRTDRAREYLLTHRDYDAEVLDGFDYDLGAVVVQRAAATGEEELTAILQAWNLRPDRFLYPWQTDDPT